ncbi:MAG: cbb3-type cytochrome c oxidase N-terminal domain-containing protein [Bacteroidota bacterium]
MSLFKRIPKTLLALVVLMTTPLLSNAQSAESSGTYGSDTQFYVISGFVFVIALIVLGVATQVLAILKTLLRNEKERKAVEQGIEFVEEPGWWQKMEHSMTDAVPVEEEDTVMLDHDYDGIKELDNHLPPWWKAMFYITIVFGVIYLLLFHVFNAMPLQEEEYQTAMAKAEEAAASRLVAEDIDIDENTVEFVDDAALIAKGKQMYNYNCQQCHKEYGEGGIGPNLTDEYWLHGGSFQDIFKTIKYGVPEKGMVAWQTVFSPVQMRNIALYVETLRGTNPANPKAPQGELYVPEAPAEEAAPTDSTEVTEEVALLQE